MMKIYYLLLVCSLLSAFPSRSLVLRHGRLPTQRKEAPVAQIEDDKYHPLAHDSQMQ